jgi:ABC-type glycerol-3-phosphate transport system substrate-binding protein
MKHTSVLLKIITLLLVLGMIAGCQPAPSAPAETEAPPAAAETEAPPAAAETEAPPAEAAPVELSFVTWSYGVETIADNIKKFQEVYPNITVTH